jgi:predicted  nucleic acid-binding Zn-ribbon protein
MPTVEEDIQFLIQIVKKDMEIKEKKKLLEAIPLRIKTIDREIKKMDESMGETKRIIEKLDAEKRHIEMELKTHHAELAKKKEEQQNIRDNKLYRAIITEMEFINKKVDQAEERMLAILDEGEARRNEIRIMTEKMSGERDALSAEKDRLQKEAGVTDDSLKILEDEKLRILPHISEEIRRLYARIKTAKGDSGVANLRGDICQGCYSRVPPQRAVEVRRNDQIMNCEVCGRILVHYEVS